MAEQHTPPTEQQPKRMSPQGRRLVVAVVLFLFIWLVFMQMSPRIVATPATPALEPAETPSMLLKPAESTAPETAEPVEPATMPVTDDEPATENASTDTPADAEPDVESQPVELTHPASVSSETLKTLEAKLDALTAITKQSGGENEAIHALDARLQAQATTLDSLKAEYQRTLRLLAAMDSYDRLKERALAGKPFSQELERLQSAAQGDAAMLSAILPLSAYAEKGFPDIGMLRTEFSAASKQLLNPAPAENAGFWEWFAHNVRQVVTIRRVGAVAGDDTSAILARAEAALDASDVEKAASEVGLLKDDAAKAMAAWLEHAHSYTSRDFQLTEVKAALLSSIPKEE